MDIPILEENPRHAEQSEVVAIGIMRTDYLHSTYGKIA